jgi:hypothetical protein
MGYFDALTSSYFKTGQNGSKLFFPWGVLGRGYLIPSDEGYERLRGQLKIYTIVSLVLIIATSALGNYLGAVAFGVALIIFYALWTRVLLRGLVPTDERLSFNDSMTSQSLHHGPVVLWALEAVSLIFVVTGLFILVADRDNWIVALASIVFFGACAAVFARMLLIRRRITAGG